MHYIALLRAINVGGKNKIKMVELREALEASGLAQVQTYIQSGNVLFDSAESESVVQQRIENSIEARFGFPIDVVVRTLVEFDSIVQNRPDWEELTAPAAQAGPKTLHVALCSETPGEDAIRSLEPYTNDQEQFRVNGRDIYLRLAQGIGRSTLAPRIQRLGIPATVRNWATIEKLRDMGHHATDKHT